MGRPQGGEVGGIINLPACSSPAGHRAAGHRHQGKREGQRRAGGGQGHGADPFVVLTLPMVSGTCDNFNPFVPPAGAPAGSSGVGVLGAAASIFFAYVGFDAVSTAAEETKNPQRNMPIGLIGSLLICTIFYLLVAAGAVGAFGAQPLADARAAFLRRRLAGARTAAPPARPPHAPLVCSKEALAYVLREIGQPLLGNMRRPRRDPRAAVGGADDDVRPDPHLLRDGARRPAAREARDRASEVPDAARSSPSSPASWWPRARRSSRSGQLADYLQRRHAVRVPAVSRRRDGAAHAPIRAACGRSARPRSGSSRRCRSSAACCCSSA